MQLIALLVAVYIDLLVMVSSNRKTSILPLSMSVVDVMDVLQPTPLCHMDSDTFLPPDCLGIVKSE